MPALEIFLLGPFQLRLAGGEPLPALRAAKLKALLAYLAVEGNPHPREALAGLLWPESPEQAARVSLRQALYQLRQLLPPAALETTRQAVRLSLSDADQLDVTAFTALIEACHRHPHPSPAACPVCLPRLTEAVSLYRGDFLSDLVLADSAAFEEWALLKREWLRREALHALYYLTDHHHQTEEFETAIGYAWRQIELDPLREEAYRQLMLALAHSGRRSEALAQYEQCRQVLQESLAEETTALANRIRVGNPTIVHLADKPAVPRPEAPRLSVQPAPAHTHNLPIQTTPFIGRERELAALTDLLADPTQRLITIVGAGGMGKSRLALAAAERQLHGACFAQGIYFVPLARLSSTEQIVPALAEALDFTFYEGDAPGQQLLNYLAQKQMLLILDNFEHLLGAAAPGELGGVDFVTEILRQAPQVKIVATSRERLHLRQEQLFPIHGLALPDQSATQPTLTDDAARLFLQSARRRRPEFEVATEDIPHLNEICRLVAGMPLALELAAAWVALLSLAEIAAEIRRSLDFLATEEHDVPDRHRTIRAVFERTWGRLSEAEQDIFARLSIFRGGFTRAAAAAVADASLPALASLANKSLLSYDRSRERYEIHELLRQYAAEQLERVTNRSGGATLAQVRDRHSAYYCALLHQRQAELKGPRQQEALAAIEAEGENVRLAWGWAVKKRRVEQLEQALESLSLFLLWRGRLVEGELLCRGVLDSFAQPNSGEGGVDQPAVYSHLQVRLWTTFSIFLRHLGKLDEATKALQQAERLLNSDPLAHLDTRLEQAQLRLEQAEVILNTNAITAIDLSEQSLALSQALGERWHQARTLDLLGYTVSSAGRLDQAWQVHQEGLDLWQGLGDTRGIAHALRSLGFVAFHQGQFDQAAELMDRSLALCRQINVPVQLAETLHQLGTSLIFNGKYINSLPVLQESLATYDDLGIPSPGGEFLMLGIALVQLGRYDEASSYLQAASRRYRETNNQRSLGYTALNFGRIALAEERDQAARSLVQESITLFRKVSHMLGLAQALATFGYIALRQNEPQAQDYLRESLQIAVETKEILPHLTALTGVALLLAARGEAERAVELYALALRYGRVANSCWYEAVAGRQIAVATETLPPAVITAATERGQARDLWATAKALLAEFGQA